MRSSFEFGFTLGQQLTGNHHILHPIKSKKLLFNWLLKNILVVESKRAKLETSISLDRSMRIPYFVDVFTTTSQDPEFDSIRDVLLQTDTEMGLLERLDNTKDCFRIVDDYPNLILWVPVFNMVCRRHKVV